MRLVNSFDDISEGNITICIDLVDVESDDLGGSVIKINKFEEVIDSVEGSFDDYLFVFDYIGLSGVVFGIYAAEDIYIDDKIVYRENELVEKIESEYGEAHSKKLVCGRYYVKELETLPNLSLNKKVSYIEIDGLKEIVEIDFSLERRYILVNYNKKTDCCLKQNQYRIGLYNSFDIYNLEGKLIFPKDSLIKTYMSDKRGNVDFGLGLPYGTYYFRELDSCNNFVDKSILEFSVTCDGSEKECDIFITKEPVEHKSKCNLIVKNNNTFMKNIFKIFDSLGNLVYENCILGSKFVDILNLKSGKYNMYIVNEYEGYVVDSKACEFLVDLENEIIELFGDLGPELFVGLRFDDVSLSLSACCMH